MSDDSIFPQSGTVLLQPTPDGKPWNDGVEEARNGVHRDGYVFGNRTWIVLGEQMQAMFCSLLIESCAPGEKFVEPFSHFRRISGSQPSNSGIAKEYPRQQSKRDGATEMFGEPQSPT